MNAPSPSDNSVGLLFTDIEGSTRLWEAFPAQMARAQAQHDTLLRDLVAEHGGTLIRSAGDSLQFSFPDALSAAEAAVEAQRALAAVDWDLPNGLSVRMAIHVVPAGAATRSPEFGLLEAMLTLANGGQVVLSSTAAESLQGRLPAEISLIDLGRRLLPDIERSEHIVQLAHPDLRTDFPPFQASVSDDIAPRTQVDRFIGRQNELQSLRRLLDQPDVRLFTLTGPGGIGKTRLAQELALEMQTNGAIPVWFVDLVGLAEPAQVMSAIASALQVQEFGHARAIDALAESLRDRALLVVLDNFEHLLPAAEEIGMLLTRAPKLRMVVTSRSPLRIRGEWQIPVEPLSIPAPMVTAWETLDRSESVELFHDRAIAANPSFTIGACNATAVAEICRKLEGVPLAIELAAPLVRVLSMEELNERLDDRLAVLRDDHAEADDRHRAIRASIAWSYELLSPATQGFFRKLGVLQSGFTLETLEGLFGDEIDVLAQIELLVEQNLVHSGGFQRDADRFFLLESVRQFALEKLEASGELSAMQSRHARYFSTLLLDRYPDQRDYGAEASQELRPLVDDLYQAIICTLRGDPERALALAAGAWRLWFITGQLDVADQWLRAVVDATQEWQTSNRVRAIYGRALTRYAKAKAQEAIELSLQSLELAERLDDQRGIGDACNYMAGMITESTRDFARSQALLDRAIDAYESCGDRHGWAETLLNRASLKYELGDYDASLEDGELLLDYCRSEHKDVLASNTIHGVAGIALAAGRREAARVLLIEGFELSRKLGYDIFLGANISVLATLLDEIGQYADALRLSEFVTVFSSTSPGSSGVSDPFDRNTAERELQLSMLTPNDADRAIADGQRLTPPEAVDQALEILSGLRA